jgi:tRNA threonylcarbamoyl adenosine modification protein YeaZ
LILALDTSTSITSIALKDAGGDIHEWESPNSTTHSEDLAEQVRRLLDDCAVQPSGITKLVYGAGPGSFTGLRIGLAFLKGMAVARRIPLTGVSSLATMATQAAKEAATICALADARRSECFCGFFSRTSEGAIKALEKECILPFQEIEEKLKRYDPAGRFVWCDPIEGFPETARPEKVAHLARGLISLTVEDGRKYSLSEIVKEEPKYLRAVAAKTIEERGR